MAEHFSRYECSLDAESMEIVSFSNLQGTSSTQTLKTIAAWTKAV